MKKAFVVFWLCCMLGQAFVRTAWVLHYQWNKASYLQHCVNQKRPGMHCDGKCYLKKKIAAAEDSEDRNAPKLPDEFRSGKELQLFWQSSEQLSSLGSDEEFYPNHRLTRRQQMFADPHRHGVFRPPAV